MNLNGRVTRLETVGWLAEALDDSVPDWIGDEHAGLVRERRAAVEDRWRRAGWSDAEITAEQDRLRNAPPMTTAEVRVLVADLRLFAVRHREGWRFGDAFESG